jgi:hypothetical protein
MAKFEIVPVAELKTRLPARAEGELKVEEASSHWGR